MKKILIILMVALYLVGCGEKYDENHSKWFNELKNDKTVEIYFDNINNNKKISSIIDENDKISLSYSIGEIFKIWMLSENIIDEDLKDLDKFSKTFDAKYDKKEKRLVFEYKSRKHYSGYIETQLGADGKPVLGNVYLYNPLSPAHDESNAVDIEKKYNEVLMEVMTNQEIHTMMINDRSENRTEKEKNISPLEEAKKEIIKDEMKSSNYKQTTYKRDSNKEYQVKINAEGMQEIAQVDFNQNGIFLTVYSEANDGDVPDEITTYNLVEEYRKAIGDNDSRTHYKIIGNEAYSVEFNNGDFGIAFLVESEDGRYLAVIRYGNVEFGTANPYLMPYLNVINFKFGNSYDYRPSEYLIENIKVNRKDIIINYGSGSKEHWKIEHGIDNYEFNLVKIS